MNVPFDHIEENLSRLILAGFGPESRPDPRARARVFQYLAEHLPGRQSARAFPERSMLALVGILILMAVCLAVQPHWTGIPPSMSLPNLIVGIVLILNLVFIPIASVVIVLRRRYV
ncbi:MAG: hypothetical protein ABSG67_18125 [Thermoguttaceae bacterium]